MAVTLFKNTDGTSSSSSSASYTHGIRFKVDKPLHSSQVGVKSYGSNTGVKFSIWRMSDGVRLWSETFNTVAGWNVFDVANPITLDANVEYILSFYGQGDFYYDNANLDIWKSETKDGITFSHFGARHYVFGDAYPESTSTTVISMAFGFGSIKSKIGTTKAKKGDGTLVTLPIYDIGVGGLNKDALRAKAGNGVVGAYDLVPLSDPKASPFRIKAGDGVVYTIEQE